MVSKAATGIAWPLQRGGVWTVIAGLCLIMVPAYGAANSDRAPVKDEPVCDSICDADTAVTGVLDVQQQEPATGQVQEPPPLPPNPAKPEFEIY